LNGIAAIVTSDLFTGGDPRGAQPAHAPRLFPGGERFHCLNHKFGQLILRKIIEIVATKCQISWLKCTKFDFGWGSAVFCPHHR